MNCNILLSDLASLKIWLDIGNDFATLIALMLGGGWAWCKFRKSREYMPGAVLEHQINHLPIANGFYMIYVDLIIRNVGKRVLEANELETRIEVIPQDCAKAYFEHINDIENIGCIRQPLPEELWKNLCVAPRDYFRHRNRLIEPSETDIINYEFIIPESYDFIRIYSLLKNQKHKDKFLGWERLTIYKLVDTELKNDEI
jgi:hypothetical protein